MERVFEELRQLRETFAQVTRWLKLGDTRLAELEARTERMAREQAAREQDARLAAEAARTVDADARVAAASSVTAIWRAREAELGVDRRTVRTRVERVVLANGLHVRFPGWATDVELNRKLASRTRDGEIVLDVALRELGA